MLKRSLLRDLAFEADRYAKNHGGDTPKSYSEIFSNRLNLLVRRLGYTEEEYSDALRRFLYKGKPQKQNPSR